MDRDVGERVQLDVEPLGGTAQQVEGFFPGREPVAGEEEILGARDTGVRQPLVPLIEKAVEADRAALRRAAGYGFLVFGGRLLVRGHRPASLSDATRARRSHPE